MTVNKTTCSLLLSGCLLAASAIVVVAVPPAWVVATNFLSIKDTCIIKFTPDTAYGASNAMAYKAGWYVTNAGGTQDLQRPMADFGNVIASLPAGSRIYGARAMFTSASGAVSCFQRVVQWSTNWVEATATWNSGAPTIISQNILNRAPWGAAPTSVWCDVTFYVDGGMRGGNQSACFGLSGGGEDNGTSGTLYTREDATPGNRPLLVVEYVPLAIEVAQLRQGLSNYTGVVDTWISQRTAYQTNNFSASATAGIETPWGSTTSRGLIKFNVDNAIPSGAKLKQALLALTPKSYQVALHVDITARECLRAWEPDANYSNYTAVAQWQLPNGLGAADQSAVVATTNSTATQYGMVYLDVTASVDKWMRGLAPNNGWFIDGGANQIITTHLSEAEASARPTLWILYETPKGTIILVR